VLSIQSASIWSSALRPDAVPHAYGCDGDKIEIARAEGTQCTGRARRTDWRGIRWPASPSVDSTSAAKPLNTAARESKSRRSVHCCAGVSDPVRVDHIPVLAKDGQHPPEVGEVVAQFDDGDEIELPRISAYSGSRRRCAFVAEFADFQMATLIVSSSLEEGILAAWMRACRASSPWAICGVTSRDAWD